MDNILDLSLEDNDAGADTIGNYLCALLKAVWVEEEGFSGKRPFGNSGWKSAIDCALVKAGLADGEIDEDGYVERVDSDAVDRLIVGCILDAFKTDKKNIMTTKTLTIYTKFPEIVKQLLDEHRRLPTKQSHIAVQIRPDSESIVTVTWAGMALAPTMGELDMLSWLACAEGCGLIRESVTRIADIDLVDNQ